MIWVVGSKGMLGTELCRQLEAAGVAFTGTDREVDFLDTAALEAFWGDSHPRHSNGGQEARGGANGPPDWILNCAAYTAVDRAEDEVELCRRLNIEGPANLARLATEHGAALVHLSTDYVFAGDAARPYREEDLTAPSGVYGKSKAEGEDAVRSLCPRSVVLRTAWLYGRDGPNFVYTMLRLMKTRESIGVVSDQRGSPTWAADLARAIIRMVGADRPRFGIYHFTDAGETNWYEFAREIHRLGREKGLLERDCRIEALTTAQYPTKARRPAYSVLSKDKIIQDYGVTVPRWEDSLAAFFASLGSTEASRWT